MKSPSQEDDRAEDGQSEPTAPDQAEQIFRYAQDLRIIMDSHQKLQVDFERLQGRQDQLDDRDQAFNRLLQDNRNLYVSTDRWGRIMHANPAAAAFLNVALPRGESILQLLPRGVVKTGKSLQVEIDDSWNDSPVTLRDASGEEHEFTLRVIHGSDARAGQAITHWLFFPQGDEERDLSWTLATTVFNGAGEGILVADHQGQILTVNPALCAMTGYPARQLVNRSPDQFIVDSDNEPYFSQVWRELDEQDHWQGRVYLRHFKGDIKPVWLALSLSRDGDGRAGSCVGLVSDMTPMLKLERHLEFAANYDALTNLPNRSLLLNRLENALALARRQRQSISILFIDLDGFKAANDRHGHDFGDFVLQEVARRLSGLVRESDTVARYGGDEFVLILHGMELVSDVEVFADKMIESMRRAVRFQGREAHIGLSMGCAQFPRHAGDSESLLQMADAAMYLAKSAGGNRLRLFEAFAQSERPRQGAPCAIEVALDRDLFKLVYQPQFDISDESPRLIGVEALLRCQSASGEFYPTPGMLLLDAERRRLSGRLTRWVLDSACRQLKSWYDDGLTDLRLSINLSSMQMRDSRFAQVVHEILDTLRIRQSSVLFDAPLDFDLGGFESMYQVEGGREQLKLLRRLGVSLTMEDSLDQRITLREFSEMPLSRLKVGPDTVAGLGRDERVNVQCQAVAALGQAFGLEVGAVGIEKHAQLDMLRSMGFVFGQGFLLARPMNADEFWRWFLAQPGGQGV